MTAPAHGEAAMIWFLLTPPVWWPLLAAVLPPPRPPCEIHKFPASRIVRRPSERPPLRAV